GRPSSVARPPHNILSRNKEEQTMKYSVTIKYDETDNIYVASVPELEGCMAHGYTREEALKEIHVAMELHLEVMQEKNLEIPAAVFA
ncbi:MAG: type II toxin-antitoxin system HicB family antitoxin, partial [Defluviitaleaceae bacterium]|nr:type II toxin-antitoxin system HicB family antitoxin [Defluviitaleaceae bacterium]